MSLRKPSSARRRSGARAIKVKEVAVETNPDDEYWGQDAFAEDEDDASFDENELSDKGEVSFCGCSCADRHARAPQFMQ
jgi:hypothetical protein